MCDKGLTDQNEGLGFRVWASEHGVRVKELTEQATADGLELGL